MRWILICLVTLLGGIAATAAPRDARFASIDGGTLALSDWPGQPVLLVNTASQCGFTYQYEGLQALYDTYRARGLVVLAVPSDDFNQELADNGAVKEFCEITFGLDLPMAEITPVRGRNAHPLYQAIARETGFVPRWNFNKVLIDGNGTVVGSWGSTTKPQSAEITTAIETVLN